jgi:hypothetical protein
MNRIFTGLLMVLMAALSGCGGGGGSAAPTTPSTSASDSTPASALTTAPTAPTGVVAVGGNEQADITWTASPETTSYNIYWSTTTGVTPASGMKITGATNPYIHAGLSYGTTYFCVVTAVNSAGESAASAQVSYQTALPVPAGVTASPGNTEATIAWTAVRGATSYNIYWSTTTGVTPAIGTKIAGASNPYTQAALNNATTYYYVVTAIFADGESAASAQVSATPGVLQFTGAMISGRTFSLSASGSSGSITFNADGTIIETKSSGSIVTGTWTISSSGQLIVKFTASGEIDTLTLISATATSLVATDSWTNPTNPSNAGSETISLTLTAGA